MNIFPWFKSKKIPVQFSKNGKHFNKDINIDSKNYFEDVHYPKVSLARIDQKYFLEVQLGNVSIDNIDIDFYQNILTIRGLRSVVSEEDYGAFSSVEAMEFLRSDIPFDDEIMANKIKAKFNSGILYIELEKKTKHLQ